MSNVINLFDREKEVVLVEEPKDMVEAMELVRLLVYHLEIKPNKKAARDAFKMLYMHLTVKGEDLPLVEIPPTLMQRVDEMDKVKLFKWISGT